jgi:2-polyprenyl-6-methoxyphenol hydroxylase-like FAD-dependent oxidoreductase
MEKKKILISGGGVAGLAALFLLDEERYDITLIEQSDRFRSVGYSVVIWKGCYDLLKGNILHNHPEEMRKFNAIDHFMLVGDVRARAKRAFEGLGYAIPREALLDIFIRLTETKRKTIRFNTTIKNIFHEGDKEAVVFNDGTREIYDMVVVSEGINSTTREKIFNDFTVKNSEYAVEYFWMKGDTGLRNSAVIFNIRNFTGNIQPPSDRSVLAYFFLKDQHGFTGQRETLRSALEDELRTNVDPNIRIGLDNDTSRIFYLKDIFLKRFNSNHVMLIGDSAHGKPPVLGLGTTLALEDAYAVSTLLNALDEREWDTDVTEKLAELSRVRRARSRAMYFLQNIVTRVSLPRARGQRKKPTRLDGFVDDVGQYLFDIAFERLVGERSGDRVRTSVRKVAGL